MNRRTLFRSLFGGLAAMAIPKELLPKLSTPVLYTFSMRELEIAMKAYGRGRYDQSPARWKLEPIHELRKVDGVWVTVQTGPESNSEGSS